MLTSEKRPEQSETHYITNYPEYQTALGTFRAKESLLSKFYGCPPQIIGRIQHFISRKGKWILKV